MAQIITSLNLKKRAAMDRFGNIAKLIETKKNCQPPEIDTSWLNLSDRDDKAVYLDMRKERAKIIMRSQEDESKLYAMILGKMSQESLDEIKRHKEYNTFNVDKDPLKLWQAIEDLHMVSTNSKISEVIKANAFQNYSSIQQGVYENIITYKERYDHVVAAYVSNKCPTLGETDIAMNFFRGLDGAR